MNTQIKYPLFFQSLTGALSFKVTGEDRGLKIDKNNIMVDPHEIGNIIRLIKMQIALEEAYDVELLRACNLVPLEEEAFNDFYYSVQDEAKKRFIAI